MNIKVAYFTRSGTSKRVAEKISQKLSCEIYEIRDNINWKGFFGFIKGGFYSSVNKEVEISYDKSLDEADEFIVVSPLWAGGAAPAIRMFLKTKSLDKVNLFITSDGSQMKNRDGYKTTNDVIKKNNNEDQVINEYIDSVIWLKISWIEII